MKHLKSLIMLFVITVFLFGCAVGTKIDSSNVKNIEKGKTTKQEVVAILGQPVMKSFTSGGSYMGGSEYWMYGHRNGLFSIILSGPEMQSLTVIFSGDIVVNVVYNTTVDSQGAAPAATSSPAAEATPQTLPSAKPVVGKALKKK